MIRIQKLYPRAKKLLTTALLIVVLGATVSCYGRFPLTHTIYKFNGKVGTNFSNKTVGKVVQQIVFWVFMIFPVYGLGVLGDIVILNLIEFWTGTAVEVAVQERLDDGTVVALTPVPGGQEADLTVSKDGRTLAAYRLIRVSPDVCEVRDSDGRLLGKTIRSAEGDLVLADARGETISTLTAADLAALPARRY